MEKRKSSGMVAVASAALTESGGGRNEIAGGVFHVGVGQFILVGVGQLHIADGAGQLFDLAGHAFVAFGAQPDAARPVHGGALADRIRPRRAHRAEVVGEDEAGAAAVGAVNDHDAGVGQLTPGFSAAIFGSFHLVILPR